MTTLPDRIRRLGEFREPFRSGSTINGDPFPLISGAAREESARPRPLLEMIPMLVEALRPFANYNSQDADRIMAAKTLAALEARVKELEK